MEAYGDFASVYDIFMEDTPYAQWADFAVQVIEKYGISRPVRGEERMRDAPQASGPEKEREVSQASGPEKEREALRSERDLVVELGCGTGTLTELLYARGYDMIGIDSSPEMLGIAMEKRRESKSGILYLCQDMRELDLYSTAGTVISLCDSINYLLEDQDILDTFRLVNNFLYPGGLFFFDFNTVYKYGTVIGDTTIAENREDCSFIWENFYHDKERINEYDLTVFVRTKQERETFRRFCETHYQRGYTLDEMSGFVERAGMKLLASVDADTHGTPDECSERIYMICRKE